MFYVMMMFPLIGDIVLVEGISADRFQVSPGTGTYKIVFPWEWLRGLNQLSALLQHMVYIFKFLFLYSNSIIHQLEIEQPPNPNHATHHLSYINWYLKGTLLKTSTNLSHLKVPSNLAIKFQWKLIEF